MLTIIQTALEAGFLYAPIALALFLSFSILNIADMTTDGAFVLGASVSAVCCVAGHPIRALPAAMLAGAAAAAPETGRLLRHLLPCGTTAPHTRAVSLRGPPVSA